jgi:prepilin-type processing-associated H-X9-DG protein/prepilin-type N-terminal cleavage/methylation domain-containing protein
MPQNLCAPVARRTVAGRGTTSSPNRHSSREGRTGNAAFTLVEVLIVVAIIAVLAALSVSTAFQVRRSGRTAVCSSNARQIGMALRLYTSDNDGAWPSTAAWLSGLPKYLGRDRRQLGCPDARAPIIVVAWPAVPGYAYSTALTSGVVSLTGNTPPAQDAAVRFPAVTVALCDAAIGAYTTGAPDPYQFDPNARPPGQEDGWRRHSGGANYGFCDGHVKWHLPDAVGHNQLGSNDGSRPSFAL